MRKGGTRKGVARKGGIKKGGKRKRGIKERRYDNLCALNQKERKEDFVRGNYSTDYCLIFLMKGKRIVTD